MSRTSGRSQVGDKPQPHHRARPSPKSPAPAASSSGLSPANPARREGGVKFGKRTGTSEMPVVSSVEESSFIFEFKQGSKKAKGMHTKVHEEKEKSREGFSKNSKGMPMTMHAGKEVEIIHCSPSIVARLMGLDTMPRPKKVHKQCHSNMESDTKQASSVGFQEAHALCEDRSRQNNTDELPELKDVFEVTEMANMKMHETLKVRNEKLSPKDSEADLDFIRQKFMDIKRLSTDEAHMNSKELNEALETLYSKKDLFLEILQEPNSLLSRHLHDHMSLQPSPHTSQTAIVKSSKDSKLHSTQIHSEQEREHQGIFHPPKEVKSSSSKHEDRLPSQYLEENYHFLPIESSGPQTESKNKASGRRSRIVVLKPNLERAQSAAAVLSRQTFQSGYGSCTQFLKPLNQSSCKEDCMQPMPSDSVEVLEPEACDSRELDQKITKQITARGSRREVSETECCCTIGNERSNKPSASRDNSINRSSSLSMHSTRPCVSRKARKHLSERWTMTCQTPVEASIPRGSSTLGEMLTLSDKETPKMVANRKASVKNFTKDNVREVPDSPLGISSKDGWKEGIHCGDGWKDGIPKTFSRSKSLPASSTTGAKLQCRRQSALTGDLPILKDILNTPTDDSVSSHIRRGRSPIRKVKQKNDRAMFGVGKENILPENEIHVNSEKLRHSICISDLAGASPVYNAHPDDAISMEKRLVYNSTVPGCQDEKQPCKTPERQPEQQVSISLAETNEDSSIHKRDDMVLEEERNRYVKLDIIEFDAEVMQSACSVSPENHECSTPTVSLQQPLGEDIAYSGFFKSINADIQELRAQLQILKMDQANTHADYSDLFLNDEDNDRDTSTHQSSEDMLAAFKDEDDRDFSYVHDMLPSLCDRLIDAEDCQVGSDVFLKLESKYSRLILWSKSDRKLLFDLANSILVDMTAPCSNLYSRKLDQGPLVENVWQAVLEKRKDLHCTWGRDEALPSDSHSEFEMIAKEISEMMQDDLLEGSLAELLSGRIGI